MKRVISLVLVTVFVLSSMLSGCGRSGNETDSGNSTTEAAAAEKTQKAGEENGTEPVTWETADLSWKKDTSPVSMSIFINDLLFPLDAWGIDEVSQQITKDTGVTLEVSKAADGQQLTVMIASGDYPDLIYGAFDETVCTTPDVSFAWDELIAKYAPEFGQLIKKEEILMNTKIDGHYYTIKNCYSSDEDYKHPLHLPGPGEPTISIRDDIMNELGNPSIESVEDLVNVFKMVKEKHPEFIAYLPYTEMTSAFAEWMGFQSVYVKDGKIYNNFSNPEYVNFYKLYNKLYRDGYMTLESFSYKLEQFMQVIATGQVFSVMANAVAADEFNKIFKSMGVDIRYRPIDTVLKVDGKIKMNLIRGNSGYAGTYITKSCKTPDRAIRFIEYLYSPYGKYLTCFGIQDKHYTLNEDGTVTVAKELREMTADEKTKKYLGQWSFMRDGLNESVAMISNARSSEFNSALSVLENKKKYISHNPLYSFLSPAADSDEGIISSKISELIKVREVEMYTAKSEEEVQQKFDLLVEDMKKMGLEKVEAYMTRTYAEVSEAYDEIMNK